MDEKIIKLSEDNFRRYLDEGKIKKINKVEQIIYETYLRNAKESLNVANHLFQNKTSSLWVVVTSYYSMFYMAQAYLYKLGYKTNEGNVHKVVNESLIAKCRNKIKDYLLENYSDEKEKALIIVDNYLDNYGREKAKRSSFQYETTEKIKESKAKTSLERAKEFLTLIEEILLKNQL